MVSRSTLFIVYTLLSVSFFVMRMQLQESEVKSVSFLFYMLSAFHRDYHIPLCENLTLQPLFHYSPLTYYYTLEMNRGGGTLFLISHHTVSYAGKSCTV